MAAPVGEAIESAYSKDLKNGVAFVIFNNDNKTVPILFVLSIVN